MPTLPPGVKTLAQVRKQADPITRVHEAKRLLEFLLVESLPDLEGPDGRDPFLSDYARARESCFSSIRDVMWAIGVRNRLDHPKRGDEPLRPEEIERAGEHLVRAVEDFLPHAPDGVATAAGRQHKSKPKAAPNQAARTRTGAGNKAPDGSGAAMPRGATWPEATFRCPSCKRKFATLAAQQQHTHDAHARKRRSKRRAAAKPKRPRRRKGVLARLVGWVFGK
ncbi:MAG: hypothetical protein KDA05_04855 [Phycisphaerales bacterium]|nr:hypothetical protein [Phycisphaerales bacterium]